MKYLILLILLCGCGKSQTYNVDPAFVKYFDEFMSYSQEFKSNVANELDVMFVDNLDPKTLGYCQSAIIAIDKAKWNKLTDTKKEMLMFHELGHCLLNRHHNDSVNADYEPVSIMYSRLSITDSYYIDHKKEYIAELFR